MRAQNPPSDGNSDWQALTDLLTSVMESYSSVEVLGLFLSELPTLPNLHAHQDLTQLLVVACSQSLHLLDSAELQDVWPGALGVLIQCTSSQDLDSASTAMDFWQVLVDKLSVQKADQLAELMEAIFTTVMHACGYPEGYVRASQEWRDDFMDFRETARMVLRSIGITWSGTIRLLCPLSHGNIASCAIGSARWLAFSAASRLEELLATDASNVAEAECVVHALSACSRKLFPAIRTSDDPGDDVQMAVLRCCQCLPQLSPHPALQRTLVLLLGVIWPWLSQHPAQLQAGFETVLNSLQIPEEDPLYPMRLMEDHVGCVALVKLARAPDSGAIFYAVFEAWQLQETRPTMTHASRQLLLESTASCALHAGGDEIFHVLNATCERATALLNICDGEGLMAWSKASLVEGLVLVLQEVAIVAKKTHGPELTHVFSELFSLDASPSFVVRLLLGTRAQPLCPVAEVTEALRDLALAALSDDDAETEQLTVSVGNVFWQHFQLKNDSAASINVFQGCIEAGGHRYARVVEQYNTIVPAVLTGIDLSAMLAGDEPNPVLAEAFFNLLSACCEHTPGILIPYTQHLTETVLCETLTFSCVALLSSASVCRSIFGLIGAMAARHDSRGCLLDHALQHNATVGPSLTCGLLTGVSELFPSFLLEDAVACFRLLLGSYGIPTVCQWLAAAINRPDFPRVSVSSTAKQQFLDDVAKASSLKGMSRLKNTIKTFCGGKVEMAYVAWYTVVAKHSYGCRRRAQLEPLQTRTSLQLCCASRCHTQPQCALGCKTRCWMCQCTYLDPILYRTAVRMLIINKPTCSDGCVKNPARIGPKQSLRHGSSILMAAP
jgi:hypothetical protein